MRAVFLHTALHRVLSNVMFEGLLARWTLWAVSQRRLTHLHVRARVNDSVTTRAFTAPGVMAFELLLHNARTLTALGTPSTSDPL